MPLTHRVTRILVYVGTADRVTDAIVNRSVKGTHITRDLVIHESVAGDCAEILDDNDLPFTKAVLAQAEILGFDNTDSDVNAAEIVRALQDEAYSRGRNELTAHIRDKADTFSREHLSIDPDTGAVTGRQEHLDYWNDLIELAEELEEL